MEHLSRTKEISEEEFRKRVNECKDRIRINLALIKQEYPTWFGLPPKENMEGL